MCVTSCLHDSYSVFQGPKIFIHLNVKSIIVDGLTYYDKVQKLCFQLQVMKLSAGTARPSSFTVLASVVRNEGFTTLYNGLSAGLLRQATYTTTRLGNNRQIVLHRTLI